MALDVEGVVDGGVRGKKFLGRPRALEPLHLAFPPPRRLMRILSSIVLPSPALMPAFDPKLSSRGAVGSARIGFNADFGGQRWTATGFRMTNGSGLKSSCPGDKTEATH